MQHGKLQTAQGKTFAALGHVAHAVSDQAAYGVKVGIAQGNAKGLADAINRGVATDAKAAVGQAKNVAVVFCNVKFVFNLADNLLQHIFDRDEACGASKLVDHDGQMVTIAPEFA